MKIKVKCPAKINLDLKILNRRPDGFHNIESTMQAIDLYDYLTVYAEIAPETTIKLSGNSDEIPYDEKNIVYKAVKEFLNFTQKTANIEVFIEKNIPVSAGLAGGSTDGAGVILALNEIFGRPLNESKMHEICAKLGSDLNFCFVGGCKKATSRGEILENAEFVKRNISLIKPINLGISAKEAYTKFADKEKTPERDNFVNDLEWAIIGDYEELKTIKRLYPNAIMTGSGSTFYIFDTQIASLNGYWVKNSLSTITKGCEVIY